MTKPVGVILAGGQARRMGGGDKGLLELGGRSLLDLVIDRLKPQVNEIVLNANGDPKRFQDLGLPVVADTIPNFAGPLAGVLAGMDWAHEYGYDRIVTVAADTPFFPHDLIEQFETCAADMSTPLVLAATQEEGRLYRHPTFGLWPVSLRDDLRQALAGGLRKVVLWTDTHNGRITEFPTEPFDPFFNLNTPDDLDVAQSLIGELD